MWKIIEEIENAIRETQEAMRFQDEKVGIENNAYYAILERRLHMLERKRCRAERKRTAAIEKLFGK
jgi:hypothetical protein